MQPCPVVVVRVQSTSNLAYLLYQHADVPCALVKWRSFVEGRCCNANKIVLPTAGQWLALGRPHQAARCTSIRKHRFPRALRVRHFDAICHKREREKGTPFPGGKEIASIDESWDVVRVCARARERKGKMIVSFVTRHQVWESY